MDGMYPTVPPEGSDLVLSSDVPHGKGDILVFDRLDVKSFRGIRGLCMFRSNYSLPMVGIVVTISPSFSL